jgi:hypothetical protein
MKNIKALPMTGLIASSILFLSNLLILVLFILNSGVTLTAAFIQTPKPLLIIGILLGLRYILVTTSNLQEFKIIINLLLLAQILLFPVMLVMSLKILLTATIVSTLVLGLAQFVLLIKFLFMLFDVKKTQVNHISFLKNYSIILLVFTVSGIILRLLNQDTLRYYIQILDFISGLSSLLLVLFFYKNQSGEAVVIA